MKSKVSVFGIFLLSIAIFSCKLGGGDDSDSNQPSGASQAINTIISSEAMKSADSVYSAFFGFVPSVNNANVSSSLPPQLPNIGPTSTSGLSTQQLTWSCSGTVTPQNPQDADQDGIPASAVADFNCSWSSTLCSLTHQGTVSVSDDSDNDPLSGWNVCTGILSPCTRDPISLTATCGSENHELRRVMDFDLNSSGNVYTFESFYFRWEHYQSSVLKHSATLEKGNSLTFEMADDGDNVVFNSGTWNGTLNLTWQDHTTGGTGSCTVTANNLVVNESCSSWAISGSIDFQCTCSSGSNATISVTFSGCGSFSGNYTLCDGTFGNF